MFLITLILNCVIPEIETLNLNLIKLICQILNTSKWKLEQNFWKLKYKCFGMYTLILCLKNKFNNVVNKLTSDLTVV